MAQSALIPPVQGSPNLSLLPGASDVTFDQLVANTQKGVAMIGSKVETDYQSRHGFINRGMREIVNGKLGAFLIGGSGSFDSSAVWKSVHAIGGASTQVAVPASGAKGQPAQGYGFTISAVPASLANMVIIRGAR